MSQSKRYLLRCINISVAISTELVLNASQQDGLVAVNVKPIQWKYSDPTRRIRINVVSVARR